MLKRIQFKVSARTARLIGRENVATSKGAIIELVKNGYDADSRYCIVLIDNKYGVYHSQITKADYTHFISCGIDQSLLLSIYHAKGDAFVEREDVEIEKKALAGFPLISGLNASYKKDVMDFMNLEVELGVLKKPISEDKIFWEDN